MTIKLSRCVARRQSSKPRESSRVQIRVRLQAKILQKKFNLKMFDFFWPSWIAHLPSTNSESFTQIGPGMCASISHHIHPAVCRSELPKPSSLRSLGFDQWWQSQTLLYVLSKFAPKLSLSHNELWGKVEINNWTGKIIKSSPCKSCGHCHSKWTQCWK